MKKHVETDAMVHFPRMQFFLMFLTIGMFLLFLFKPLTEFKSHDKGPEVIPISPKIIQKFKKEDKIVSVTLYIHDSPEFDLEKNNFSYKGIVSFAFDPKVVSLDTIKQFSIEKGTIEKSEPRIRTVDGKTVAEFIIDVTFSMQVDYSDFPIDDHRVSFALINQYLDPNKVLLVTDQQNFIIEQPTAMMRWREVGKHIINGQLSHFKGISYSAILFTIDYEHSAIRQTSIILLPLFIIFFLASFGLSLNIKEYHKTMLMLSTAGISALMAYQYVIAGMVPKVGYFMFIDYLYFLFLFTVFFVFISTMFIERIPIAIRRFFIIGLYLWVIGFCGYFILFWL